MKVAIDKDLCTGCGLCCDECPVVFDFDGDTAAVKVERVAADAEESCRDAAEQCPTEAITIEES